jgi:hypothetical protein
MNIIVVFISAFLLGCLSVVGIIKAGGYFQLKKLQKESDSIYSEIVSLIGTKSVKFLARYNETVTFQVLSKTKGEVHLMVFLDKRDIGIFRKGECLYNTQYVTASIVDNIFQLLESFHRKDIMDCVQVMGNIIDKRTMRRLNPNASFPNAFNEEEVEEEPQFTIDEILDRINQVGFDNLTELEIKFLKQNGK